MSRGDIAESAENLTENETRGAKEILGRLGRERDFRYPKEEAQALFIGAYRIVGWETLSKGGKADYGGKFQAVHEDPYVPPG